MPDPSAYDSESEFMSECVSQAVGEGRDQDQAVAMCLDMWRRKSAEGEVEKADTHRNAAKRALTGILSLLEEKTIPETLRSQLEHARDALRSTWGDLEAEAGEVLNQAASLAKAVTRKEQDGEHPASHYLVVEDPEKPTTWHLRVLNVDGNPDHRLMGAAWAALHGGYRGSKYQGPDKDKAIAKLRQMYKSEDLPIPGEEKAVELPMLLTKTQRMTDGRIRWQARANTGEWDLEHERFDVSFWDDVLHNFSVVQEATTKGEATELPVPILDIAHYSFRLPPEKRSMARCGYPIKLWQDGKALMAQGYFDNTPLGQAAAVAATKRPVEDRRVSIGVWPDWGRVELDEQGRRIYKGGRNRAYLDHLAMTSAPVDPGTELEVKSMTQKQDALDVLGSDAQALVDELEAATTKAAPDAAIVKTAECACETEKAKPKPVDVEAEAAEGEGEAEPAPKPEPTLTMRQLKQIMADLFETFGKSLDERLQPIEASTAQIPAIKAQVEALGATETEKVKAAIDSGGDWLTQLVKKSVQRQRPVEGAEPQATIDTSDPFYRVFGGLKKQ